MFQYNDRVRLVLAAGSGGNGCLSFYRTRTNPRGGPDGGDGGKGGNIILKASAQVKSLEHFDGINRLDAEPGLQGQKQKKSGKAGKDLFVSLPLGTLVRNEKEEILMDLPASQEKIFLDGGRGAKGNVFFKNSKNQAPKQVQIGEKGQTQRVIFELKPLIDVALMGEVNSGKSTFFNEVTNADSQTGDYPYTTLIPYLGQMEGSLSKFFLMDMPGLETGAHKRVSQGLAFIRSLQRAKLLLHFVACDCLDPLESKNKIEKEIEAFDKQAKDSFFTPLSDKKKLMVLSRSDAVSENEIKDLNKKMGKNIFVISCHSNHGVKELLSKMESILLD